MENMQMNEELSRINKKLECHSDDIQTFKIGFKRLESDWYTNKQLFEMLSDVRRELGETRDMIRKYNGLSGRLGDIECLIKEQAEKTEEKEKEKKGDWKWVLGWSVAILSLLLNYLGG